MFKFVDEVSPAPSARSSAMDLEMDPQVKLENYEWAELEDQFAKRMEAFRAEEDGIWDEWKGWGEIFKAWASTISVHDEERAAKRYVDLFPRFRAPLWQWSCSWLFYRLRTRIAYTQGSEESLEAKRQHCKYPCLVLRWWALLTLCATDIKVVQAFESALQLLGSRHSAHNFI